MTERFLSFPSGSYRSSNFLLDNHLKVSYGQSIYLCHLIVSIDSDGDYNQNLIIKVNGQTITYWISSDLKGYHFINIDQLIPKDKIIRFDYSKKRLPITYEFIINKN